jgi:hypothetical protein
LASLQKQIDELNQQLSALKRKYWISSGAALDVSLEHTKAINELNRRTLELHDQDFSINRRVNRIFRAHNRHVLSTVEPRKQAPGWARNKARDRRTWAKPKGWRL